MANNPNYLSESAQPLLKARVSNARPSADGGWFLDQPLLGSSIVKSQAKSISRKGGCGCAGSPTGKRTGWGMDAAPLGQLSGGCSCPGGYDGGKIVMGENEEGSGQQGDTWPCDGCTPSYLSQVVGGDEWVEIHCANYDPSKCGGGGGGAGGGGGGGATGGGGAATGGGGGDTSGGATSGSGGTAIHSDPLGALKGLGGGTTGNSGKKKSDPPKSPGGDPIRRAKKPKSQTHNPLVGAKAHGMRGWDGNPNSLLAGLGSTDGLPIGGHIARIPGEDDLTPDELQELEDERLKQLLAALGIDPTGIEKKALLKTLETALAKKFGEGSGILTLWKALNAAFDVGKVNDQDWVEMLDGFKAILEFMLILGVSVGVLEAGTVTAVMLAAGTIVVLAIASEEKLIEIDESATELLGNIDKQLEATYGTPGYKILLAFKKGLESLKKTLDEHIRKNKHAYK